MARGFSEVPRVAEDVRKACKGRGVHGLRGSKRTGLMYWSGKLNANLWDYLGIIVRGGKYPKQPPRFDNLMGNCGSMKQFFQFSSKGFVGVL